MNSHTRPTTVCCYFPNYYADARNERVHGCGWTEWELVRRAEPRLPGHRQPRVPLWCETDETVPAAMAQKVAAAADHGIDAFLAPQPGILDRRAYSGDHCMRAPL